MSLDINVTLTSKADPYVTTALNALFAQGVKLMAQIDDLKAALADDSTKLDAVATTVTAVASEVADLIARLATMPPSTDLTDAITSAQSIGTRLNAVAEALAAVPPAPPQV